MSHSKYDKWMAEEDHYKIREHWHGWAGNFRRYILKRDKEILKKLNINKTTKILEIGCGTSLLGEIFTKEECPNITAFDIAKINIEKGKKKFPYINFLIDDAQNPKIKGEFDLIFASEIIEHLKNPREAMEKWIKLLKKDGYIIISTPNSLFFKESEEHISLIAISHMKRILKDRNLKLIKIIGIDLFIPFLGRLSKYLKKFPKLSDFIYSTTMRLPYNLPILARGVIYIAKK